MKDVVEVIGAVTSLVKLCAVEQRIAAELRFIGESRLVVPVIRDKAVKYLHTDYRENVKHYLQ